MGYSTDFFGRFELNKKLDDETNELLVGLSTTRRMKRDVGPEYGVEGEFYFDGQGSWGQDNDSTVIDHNQPPSTQPGLWCQWRPTEDRLNIEWDEAEKFYHYVEWIDYIIQKILKPKGYKLNGAVKWIGDDRDDRGVIDINDNVISIGSPTDEMLYRTYESKYDTSEEKISMEF